MEFNKFLMGIHNGLGSKDMRKLRFLCRDLDIPIQSLEQLQRGLHLFKELQKMMLLSKDDVSLLIELMGAISRKDLVNKVSEWPTASEYSKPRISQYRRLLLCIALDLTSEEFEDMKSMASGPISSNMEEIKDPLEFFVLLEKECLISRKDVAFLHDILPNPQMKEKVKECERDVLGHTPSGTSAVAAPIPPSSTTARGIYPQERRQPNPPSLGESGNIYPLHSHPYFVQEPGTHHPNPYINPYMVQPSSAPYQTYQYSGSRPEEDACPPDSQVQQTNTNLIPGRDSRMDIPHHMFQPLSSALTSKHPYGTGGVSPNTHHLNANPTSGYHIKPTAIIQPQSAASYSSQPPGVPSPQAGPYLPNMQQTSANYSGVRGTIPVQHPGSICHGGDQHYQAPPYAANRTDFPQQQDVLGMERSFRNLSVMQKQEEGAKVCSRQMHAELQQGTMLLGSQNPNVAHQPVLGSNEAFPQESGDAPTASNAATPVFQIANDQIEYPRGQRSDPSDPNPTGLVSFAGNFPLELDKQIRTVCKNISELQPNAVSSLTSVDHLLHTDSPNTEPSCVEVSPSDLKIPARGVVPCYRMTSNPRGLAIIINNEKFEERPGSNLEFRTGSFKDAGRLLDIFIKLKFNVRCMNNLSARQMYDLLEIFRSHDHRQYDCFVCCILSHGREGEVYGSDGVPIPIRELTGLFTGVKCQSLVGKPKLFFIQACQGEDKQVGVKPLVETDSPQDSIATTPNENDFLVGYSTELGYASYRNPKEGSWYVISLVKHLEKYHDIVDMSNILAMVNGHMGKCSDAQGFKQSSFHKNKLTKALYL